MPLGKFGALKLFDIFFCFFSLSWCKIFVYGYLSLFIAKNVTKSAQNWKKMFHITIKTVKLYQENCKHYVTHI